METDDLRSELGSLRFCETLPADAVAEMATAARSVDFAPGTVLFREGDKSRELFLIVEGRIALEMTVPGRGEITILTLGAGDLVGWSALIGSEGMTTMAITVDETRAIAFDGTALLDLCQGNHSVGYQLMGRLAAALAGRLTATRLQLLDLFHNESPQIDHERGTP